MKTDSTYRWLRRVALCSSASCFGLIAGCSEDAARDAVPTDARGRLEAETGTRWLVDVDPATGIPDLLVAVDPLPPMVVKGNYEAAARTWIGRHRDLFKLQNVASELETLDVAIAGDRTGHVRFRQRAGGVRVENSVLGAHFRPDGSLAVINAVLAPRAAETNGTPSLDPARAIATAESALAKTVPGFVTSSSASAPELVLHAQGATATLGWRLTLAGPSATGPVGRSFLVDARTGAIADTYSTLQDVEAKGRGVKNDEKTFAVVRRETEFQMVASLPIIATFDANRQNAFVSSATLEGGWDEVAVGAGAAVDAHAYVTRAIAWFQRVHGWSSFDGKGGLLAVYAHDNAMRNNAWWDGQGGMHFSDGDTWAGGTLHPLSAAADVVGHELMHAVIQHSGGLPYRGESGALNEAFADIFGSYIEADIEPGSRFEIGERMGLVIRNFEKPVALGQPDHMSLRLYAGQEPTAQNDWGGVHSNSGIVNNAWYLMTIGGINETSQITVLDALGFDTSRTLWWETLRYFAGSAAELERTARWQTAWASAGGHPVAAVGCAWVATGVLTFEYVKDEYEVACGCTSTGGADGGGALLSMEMTCCQPGEESTCCKACDGAGSQPSASGPAGPDAFDSCAGRPDGVHCSQLAAGSAIVCRGGAIEEGVQCPEGQACRSTAGGDACGTVENGAVVSQDSCAGRADGIYCSTLAPYSAIECKDGAIAGGQQCPNGQTCAGPNGPGALRCR